jgi:hypothetical protein
MIEFITFVDGTHFLLLVFNNLKNISHDVREESYTKHHYDYCRDHFDAADGIVISISNGGKCCESKITGVDQLLIFVMKIVF